MGQTQPPRQVSPPGPGGAHSEEQQTLPPLMTTKQYLPRARAREQSQRASARQDGLPCQPFLFFGSQRKPRAWRSSRPRRRHQPRLGCSGGWQSWASKRHAARHTIVGRGEDWRSACSDCTSPALGQPGWRPAAQRNRNAPKSARLADGANDLPFMNAAVTSLGPRPRFFSHTPAATSAPG